VCDPIWMLHPFSHLINSVPDAKPNGKMIHGRHSDVSLNFQAKIPTVRMPKITPMILGSMISNSVTSIRFCHFPFVPCPDTIQNYRTSDDATTNHGEHARDFVDAEDGQVDPNHPANNLHQRK
jgi:hypothetical protein